MRNCTDMSDFDLRRIVIGNREAGRLSAVNCREHLWTWRWMTMKSRVVNDRGGLPVLQSRIVCDLMAEFNAGTNISEHTVRHTLLNIPWYVPRRQQDNCPCHKWPVSRYSGLRNMIMNSRWNIDDQICMISTRWSISGTLVPRDLL